MYIVSSPPQVEMKTQAGRAVRSAAEKNETILPFPKGGEDGVPTLIGQTPR